MTALEALRAAERASVPLRAVGDRLRAPRPAIDGLSQEVRDALHEHRERIAAALRLREIHRGMGLDDVDILMIETAILEGLVGEIVIVPGPPGVTA